MNLLLKNPNRLDNSFRLFSRKLLNLCLVFSLIFAIISFNLSTQKHAFQHDLQELICEECQWLGEPVSLIGTHSIKTNIFLHITHDRLLDFIVLSFLSIYYVFLIRGPPQYALT